MRHRLLMAAAILASGALAACGGGGGGTVSPAPVATTAVATPSSLTFSGSDNLQAIYGYPAASPYPAENVTSTISLKTTAYTGVVSGVNLFYTAETQVLPNVTHTFNVQTGAQVSASGTAGVNNVGIASSVVADDSSDKQTINYATPLVVDQQPENVNATWTNTAALTSAETFADGSTDARTQNADGSYNDELVSPDGTDATLTVNSDGSSSLSTPASNPSISGGCIQSYSFGAPSAYPGGTFTISIMYNAAALAACTGSATTTNPFTETANAWFPPVDANDPLYSDTTMVNAASSYPGSCNVPATAPAAAKDIERTVESTDPLLGYLEETETDTFTSASGAECVIMQDDVLSFYDWQGTNTNGTHNFLTGNPIQESLDTQTLTLQSGAGAAVGAEASAVLSPQAIAAAEANFGSRITLGHTKKVQSMLRALRTSNPVMNIIRAPQTRVSFKSMHIHHFGAAK